MAHQHIPFPVAVLDREMPAHIDSIYYVKKSLPIKWKELFHHYSNYIIGGNVQNA